MSDHRHEGHRERLKERFITVGGKSLADHELLEALLYYIIPRKDTNDLAHRLIESCGSFAAVLEADTETLGRVEGVGENVALFLRFAGESARRYAVCKMQPKGPMDVYDTPAKIAAFLAAHYVGVHVERVYLLLFDNGMHMLDCYHVCDGSVNGVPVSMRRMVCRAFEKNAAAAVLAHNHPGGEAMPSAEDVQVTERLRRALETVEIPLLEHYVFSERSFAPVLAKREKETAEAYAVASMTDLLRVRRQELEERKKHS